MADNDRYDGRPSGVTPVHPDSSGRRDVGPAPVDKEHGTPPDQDVKVARRGRPCECPSDLLTDAGWAAFVVHAAAWLQRKVPPWMADQAWDVAMETAELVRRSPEKFRSMSGVYAYAGRTMGRAAGRRRRASATRGLSLELVAEPLTHETPERVVSACEAMDHALRILTEAQRRIVVATRVEGMTALEVARSEGRALQTIYNLVRDANQRLNALRAKQGPE